MNNQCPRCSGHATITSGRFRDLTNARFDTEYDDDVLGMATGVKINCPECGEINLYRDDYARLLTKEIDPEEIDKFKAAFPGFKGVLALGTWLSSRNDKDSSKGH
ncbi:hypothetical protein U4T63_22875 [Klebsiella pneumoniae]